MATGAIYAAGGRVYLPDGLVIQPFAGWSGPLNVAVAGEVLAVGAGYGGGPRLQVRRAGRVVYDGFPFEPSVRNGVTVATDGRLVWVGTGPGGGPRVRVFDADAGAWVQDFFAGDPATRAGVVIAVAPAPPAAPPTPPAPPAVPLDLARLGVSWRGGADPTDSDWAAVRADLAALPAWVVPFVGRVGARVDFVGGPLAAHPLLGDAAPAGRTGLYQATTRTLIVSAWAGDGSGILAHEIGHLVSDYFGPPRLSDRREWQAVYAAAVAAWPAGVAKPYELTNAEEFFAESAGRAMLGRPPADPAAAAFVAGWLGSAKAVVG